MNDDMSAATADHSDRNSDAGEQDDFFPLPNTGMLGSTGGVNVAGVEVSADMSASAAAAKQKSFNALQEKLYQLSANRDEEKIAAQQNIVNHRQVSTPFCCFQYFIIIFIIFWGQLDVISLCIEIEKLVEQVHIVAARCIKLYNECETRNHRFKQFEELTCMLGDGMAPTVGNIVCILFIVYVMIDNAIYEFNSL